MQAQITNYEKSDFIKQFLNVYEPKRQEAGWILTYLTENKNLLSNVRFVKEAKYCPRAMILSTTCSDQVPFLFYKGKVITDNPDKLFHDIRLHPNEVLYVQLNTAQLHQAHFYTSILDDNPYVPNYWQTKYRDQKKSDDLLDKLQYDYQKQLLEIQIDAALEKKDESEFLRLVNLLKQL